MKRVVFLCVGNSARSQMAEGLLRALHPELEVHSAGSAPGPRVNPLAVEAMREVGVDISAARPKHMKDVPLESADLIVTLCAEEVCPVTPARVRREHWPLPDPVDLHEFRAVHDELRKRIEALRF